MGQAIIFKGVTVDTPLETVSFVKTNITAQDYLDDYKSRVTTLQSGQEVIIKTFIETLISAGLWDKVERCYPMLGGIGYYTYDLKKITNQNDWDFPESSVSWDETRNAPLLSIAGNKSPKDIIITGLDCINKGCAFFLSEKQAALGGSCQFTDRINTDLPSFIKTPLYNSNGGYTSPRWCTPLLSSGVEGFNAKNKNTNNNFLLNIKGGMNSLYAWNDNNDANFVSERETTTDETTTDAVISLGCIFHANVEAPAQQTLNGCVNLFMVFNNNLSTDEIKVLNDAVYNLNQGLGRYIDFD